MSPHSSTNDTSDETLIKALTSFTPITEFPVPTGEEAVREYAENHPGMDPDDDEIGPDTLYFDGVNSIAENHDWHVFQVTLYGFSNDVYVWNKQLGEGLRIPTDEWQFGTFAEVISLARDNDDAWNLSEDPVKPDSDGCPYCDDAGSDEMSSSLRASGSYKQRCNECGRSRLIG